MLSVASEKIVDLIGGIKPAENRLGGRNPGQGKGKSVPKNARSGGLDEKIDATTEDAASPDIHARLGMKVDTTV